MLAVAALALLILALLAVVFVPGLLPTDDTDGVVAEETPTKQVTETEPPAAPTVAPPAIPTPTTEPTPVTPARLPEIHTVVIKPDYDIPSFKFDPVNCTIARNDSVVWLNEDDGWRDTYVLTSDEGLWPPTNILFGSEFTYTFNSSGTYHYGCEYFHHMKGTIIVK